jgi:hypothetical protein
VDGVGPWEFRVFPRRPNPNKRAYLLLASVWIQHVPQLGGWTMKMANKLRTKSKVMLMRIGLFGPVALAVADKIAHALGLGCLGL